jgi:small subunit ribosomal protein S17
MSEQKAAKANEQKAAKASEKKAVKASEQKSNKRVLEGVVTSNKAEKTVIVQVERKYLHPQYHKTIRTHKKYMAHDEAGECNIGDTVRIVESRPLSARKRWALQAIVSRAEVL